MPDFVQNTFNAGVFSSLMNGRTDFAKYFNSARVMVNMVPLKQGAATRLPGTRFVTPTKTAGEAARVVGFEFSEIQTYIILMGDVHFWFFKDREQIFIEATDTAVANGTFAADISGWTDQSGAGGSIAWDAANARLSLISDGVGDGHAEQAITVAGPDQGTLHAFQFDVFGVAGDVVKVRVGTTSKGTELIDDFEAGVGHHVKSFIPGAATVYVQFLHTTAKTLGIDTVAFLSNQPLELRSPYAADDLFQIFGTQSNDIKYLCHGNYAIRTLNRFDHTDWSVIEYDMIDGPYFPENITDTTLTLSLTTGLGKTITASSTKGINSGAGFKATDVGRALTIKHGSVWGWGRIVGVASATEITLDIRRDFDAVTAQEAWKLGLYSDTTGHPVDATFDRNRLQFGGSADRPGRLDGSKAGAFDTFTPGVNDDDPTGLNIDANAVPNIRWLASFRGLNAGTIGGEFRIAADKINTPLTPANIQSTLETSYGAAQVQPVQAGEANLFVQRHGRDIREQAFSFEKDGLVAPDMTALAEHITQSGIREMAFQQEPFSVLWSVLENGQLIGMVYERSEDVIGFFNTDLGGQYRVRSVAVIPGAVGDELWLVIDRAVGGVVKTYVEHLEDPFDEETELEDAFFVMSGLTFTGAELLTNGAFETDITGWTDKSTGAAAISWHGFGYLSLDGSAAGDTAHAEQSAAVTIGTPYRLRFEVVDKIINVRVGTTSGGVDLVDDRQYAVGKHSLVFTPTATTIYIGFFHSTDITSLIDAVRLLTPAQVISGLGHWEGEKVQILRDGAVHPEKTVSGSAITLDVPGSIVQVGKKAPWKLRPQPPEIADPAGSSIAVLKDIHHFTVMFQRTLGFQYGPDEDTLVTPAFGYGKKMDSPPPLFSGAKQFAFEGAHDRDGTILMVGADPTPATLNMIRASLGRED